LGFTAGSRQQDRQQSMRSANGSEGRLRSPVPSLMAALGRVSRHPTGSWAPGRNG
jgi:hypothetical protein